MAAPDADDAAGRTAAFERRAREVLDESASRLPAHLQSRLNQARHRALDALAAREARPAWQRWLGVGREPGRGGSGGWGFAPAGAVAAVAVVAVVLWTGRPGAMRPGTSPADGVAFAAATFEDIDLLADAEGLDLAAAGDLEFLEWAALASEATMGEVEADGEVAAS
jgi:hypothetical protein